VLLFVTDGRTTVKPGIVFKVVLMAADLKFHLKLDALAIWEVTLAPVSGTAFPPIAFI
jgi:hypothetical protein